MHLNSKKELRLQRIERALKANLKKRKIFQNKINKEIKKMAIEKEMIKPFVSEQKSSKNISYGLSSYGYDARV